MNQNMSAVQTDAVFTGMCQEVSAAYYCVDYHLTAAQGTNMTSMGPRNNMTANQDQRLSLLNTTLHSIGDFVGKACQGVFWFDLFSFNPIFNSFCLITAASSPFHVFPGFLTPVNYATIFPSNWLIFHKVYPLVKDP